MNFRTKLLITLIPIAVIAVGSIAVSSYLSASEGIIRMQKYSMEVIVNKTINDLSSWFSDRERDVRIFSKDPVLVAACKNNNMEDAENRLKDYHKMSPFYENIFIADHEGKIFKDSIDGKSGGMNISEMPEYEINVTKAKSGEVWTGEVAASPATGRPVSLITAPVFDNEDNIIGIIGTPVELNVFSDNVVSNIRFGKTGYIFIADSRGILLAHPDKSLINNLNLYNLDFGKIFMAKKNGELEYLWKGDMKIAVFKTNKDKNWFVGATIIRNEFLASVKRIKYISFTVGFIAMMFMVFAVLISTGRAFSIIRNTVESLGLASSQIEQAAGEVSCSSQDLAEGASRQAAALEQTSATLEQLSAYSKDAANLTDGAKELMNKNVAKTAKSLKALKELTYDMGKIEEDSSEIGSVAKNIDEIAFQTNLLALNAAVEAARAGDAGAGFAVVADEVRNLALKAGDAAMDSQELLEGMRNRIITGANALRKMSNDFGSIVESATIMGEKTVSITTASREQSISIQQVTKASIEIDDITQVMAANAQESAAASEELLAQSKSMNELVNDLSSITGTGSDKFEKMKEWFLYMRTEYKKIKEKKNGHKN